MGWNSWDGYGTTINEDQVKANAAWFAQHLKPFGWEYIVIDMEWFVTNPTAEGNSKNSLFTLDSHGRYIPALNRFPSSADGKGFKPIGDYIHSLGLKFGIHILRGIPKKAVESNAPIAALPTMPRRPRILLKPAPGTRITSAQTPQCPPPRPTTIR